jgi:hypothetical protein
VVQIAYESEPANLSDPRPVIDLTGVRTLLILPIINA